MKFFNKKEDVLEIKLTQYGKHKLSLGELNPAYYAFFDDDVLYDSRYAGEEEDQNYTQDRIEKETPSLRVQHVFSGRETSVVKNNTRIRKGMTELRDKSVQQTPDREYSLSLPLGTSDLSSDHQPAWDLMLLSGKIKEVAEIKTGAHSNQKIPQINLEPIVWKTTVHRSESPDVYDEFEPEEKPGSNFKWKPIRQFEDNTFIALAGDDLIIEIDEENVPFLNENFEVEVFMVENVDERGRIVEPAAIESEKNIVERLVPLYWEKEYEQVRNGILMDEDPNFTIEGDDGSSMVGTFLEIQVDNEISDNRMCQVLAKHKSSGSIHTDFPYNCPEETENIDRAVHGLYDSIFNEADDYEGGNHAADGTDDDPHGEDCH